MAQVRIVKPVRLTRADGTTQDFSPTGTNIDGDDAEPGLYEVSEEDANHPYLQHFTNKPPKEKEAPNSQAAIEASARAQARLRQQEFLNKQQELEAVNEVRRKRAAGPRGIGVMGETAVDPIAAPSKDGGIPRATPPGEDNAQVNPSGDPNDHDAQH